MRLEARVAGRVIAVTLQTDKAAVIGRSAEAELSIEADDQISRRHAVVLPAASGVRVKRISGSRNPIYFQEGSSEDFLLAPGESFFIGRTRFTLIGRSPQADEAEPSATAVALKTLTAADLYCLGESQDIRLRDILELPEILRSRQRRDFHTHIAELLRTATRSSWACVVTEEGNILGSAAEGQDTKPYHPSRTLIQKALQDAPQPTLYSWNQPGPLQATVQEGLDWAACAAANLPSEKALVFYATGGGPAADMTALRDRARFVGLVADMVGRSLSVDRLLTWEGRLERFFSGPVVSQILKSEDLSSIEPRLALATVLFFDIRGFSQRTEDNNAEILGYIGRLKAALSAMTAIILSEQGVVLQYMGDGILACWNVPFDVPDHAARAARAALRMAAAFERATDGWRCGIGLHTGEVVAGAIGSEQIFSYGVLGMVVNLASRVEGITKIVGAPVLATSEVVSRLPAEAISALRLGKFKPAGMSATVELYELSQPPGDPRRAAAVAAGVESFEKGDWNAVMRGLGALPSNDKPAAFLRDRARAFLEHPPIPWNGTIDLSEK